MAIETIVRIGGKVEINFCFKKNLEKTYCLKSGAS